jgi:hypothetical protein
VAVIGHRFWQMRYGADPHILGKTIELDQKRYTIVGVMPASFRFTWDQERDVFVPLALTPEERSESGRGTSRDLQTQAQVTLGRPTGLRGSRAHYHREGQYGVARGPLPVGHWLSSRLKNNSLPSA